MQPPPLAAGRRVRHPEDGRARGLGALLLGPLPRDVLPGAPAYHNLCVKSISVSVFFNLTQSVYQVVLQTSIPAQIRQLILYVGNSKG